MSPKNYPALRKHLIVAALCPSFDSDDRLEAAFAEIDDTACRYLVTMCHAAAHSRRLSFELAKQSSFQSDDDTEEEAAKAIQDAYSNGARTLDNSILQHLHTMQLRENFSGCATSLLEAHVLVDDMESATGLVAAIRELHAAGALNAVGGA